jgi:hypothetical protein
MLKKKHNKRTQDRGEWRVFMVEVIVAMQLASHLSPQIYKKRGMASYFFFRKRMPSLKKKKANHRVGFLL